MSQDTTDRTLAAEERIAHLLRAVDELSDQTRAQAERIARLEAQMAELRRRDADRDAGSGGLFFADERPPHW
ncbi:SlyX family protein [Rhodobacteraceae bacterium 2376]|uniref:SlyX family protein n=1 Tax=Rhabdonatronobacter sediminivivens TaxID=2743469 RepID=A0A7Z0I0L3_9RHOB|nr:SlyX family protein [Rhabdonatronobacter sediminivivens]NYS25736.1 SlyX family protein [Rhabdonatronobacter sediminivivens]